MENKLKVYPVMIPQTGEPKFPCVCIGTPELGLRYTESRFGLESTQYFSLYLVSDREIKEGDWCYYKHWENGKEFISKATKDIFRLQVEKKHKKIEATADKSLGLPLIPESFVKEWVEKQGKIEFIYIQGIWIPIHKHLLHSSTHLVPDINDGEVIILPIRFVFTKEDMLSAWLNSNGGAIEFEEWFDKYY